MNNKKEYFFYHNTEEYCTIIWYLLISISIIVSVLIIKLFEILPYKFDILLNILLALATGYIV